jgi:hypothetical protein
MSMSMIVIVLNIAIFGVFTLILFAYLRVRQLLSNVDIFLQFAQHPHFRMVWGILQGIGFCWTAVFYIAVLLLIDFSDYWPISTPGWGYIVDEFPDWLRNWSFVMLPSLPALVGLSAYLVKRSNESFSSVLQPVATVILPMSTWIVLLVVMIPFCL